MAITLTPTFDSKDETARVIMSSAIGSLETMLAEATAVNAGYASMETGDMKTHALAFITGMRALADGILESQTILDGLPDATEAPELHAALTAVAEIKLPV